MPNLQTPIFTIKGGLSHRSPDNHFVILHTETSTISNSSLYEGYLSIEQTSPKIQIAVYNAYY